jgi:phosphoglycolate phosphatase
MRSAIQAVWWDLDGTLVDSAPTILAALESAFKQLKVAPQEPLHQGLIGPPLNQLLSRLLAHETASVRAQVLAAFKHHYDTEACWQTKAYAGVDAVLAELQQRGFKQRICTNKRLLPTRHIIHALGWQTRFEAIHALPDYQAVAGSAPLAHKSDMVADILLGTSGVAPAAIVLVGDTPDDQIAAQMNQLQFAAARWGYGQVSATDQDWSLLNCQDLLTIL